MKIINFNLLRKTLFFILIEILTAPYMLAWQQGYPTYFRTPIIMFDPAGDALCRGRKLTSAYERGETFKLVKKLQEMLESQGRSEVVIARTLGEEKLPYQVAAFANRLEVDVLVHIGLYHESSPKPKIYLYQHVTNPLIDFAPRSSRKNSFVPLIEAHFDGIHQSKKSCVLFKHHFQKYEKIADVFGPYGLPLKSLVGMVRPAFMIEIGVHADTQWETLVSPLAECLSLILQK